jgi:hypothetical protein
VSDDPERRGALFGGSFDDAGFLTERRPLAGFPESRRADGPGWFRRPSYREEPRASPSCLFVEPPAAEPPRDGVLVTTLRVHPLGREWAIAIEGCLLDEGVPVATLRPGIVRADPADLVRGCAGGVGPVRESYRGVATPALRFDDCRLG